MMIWYVYLFANILYLCDCIESLSILLYCSSGYL